MSSSDDELARLKQHLEPPWDEVKEQRVLARVLAARKRTAEPAQWRPRLALPAVAAAAVAFGAAVFILRPSPSPRELPQATTTAPSPAAAAQTMALADGSQAILIREAGLQVEEQRPEKVAIVQRRGTVRYEVKPNREREFSVRAGGNLVRVRGTIFTVEMSAANVEVAVTRGRVEVDDGARTRELSAGESLRVPLREASDPAAASPSEWDAEAAPPSNETVETRRPSAAPTAAELQARADRARVGGDLGAAASALEQLVGAHPRDPRVPNALVSLGRVERDRGRHASAARAYERCVKASPDGPLAQDALAEAAVSWSLAGASKAARANASSYLARYPKGTHVQRMKAIIEP
jgi:transmembrane sensor